MRLIGTAVLTAGMGLTALGVTGPALASQPADGDGGGAAPKTCRYEVTPRDGVNVRKTPQGTKIGALPYRQHFTGSCTTTKSYVQILGGTGVPKNLVKGWVFSRYVKKIPSGGVGTGGGGTASTPDYMMAGAGLGAIVLGGGLALSTRRRVSAGR
ncbi:hypothetical protein [Actinomadura sp. WMMB 499]|uniref:hypothetical protein n=1 Tax=Actinomadura sp. WMMB 499 TaxID=1219491 RepID=UPI001246ABED|nr:hypothetical protein [Actinomadura sp. WMMB 499]QFG21982.1 hypothetical protein F7P10_13495 [Actinomadura sp. WMMB 499]